jgi:glycosyltransferase involved in cell wall biosynthesis
MSGAGVRTPPAPPSQGGERKELHRPAVLASATRDTDATKTHFAKIISLNANAEPEADPAPAQIAVAIPCYNEAAAIATVIAQFRAVLPNAAIIVYDNNSTDGTGEIARDLGVRTVPVPRQGKGHAVRAAFADLSEFDVIVLTDGDGTYPADAAPLLIAPVLADAADMAVGARQPTPGAGAMTLTRGLGNKLIRAAFRLLIGSGTTDLLSGYRAFNKRFRTTVQLRSAGFEIEAELASEAVARQLRAVEVPIPYYPRIAGTESKLRAFRDGWRIVFTILSQSLRLRPHRALVAWLLPCVALALTVNRAFAAVAGLGLIALWSLLLFDIRARRLAGRSGHA